MKLRYLFSIILSALFFAGCAEIATDSFDNIKLSKTYVSIPVDGGSANITITATEDWAFVQGEDWPEWLSVDKTSGAKGETVVTFSAEANAGREAEVTIKAGANTQFLRVRQGSLEAASATCAEVNAGPDGKTYKVKGVVTSIVNTQYGNWYLKDDTGEVYVYGTLDKNGKTKNFESLGLEVGDVVEVQGPKLTYGTTVELVDVTVLSITKAFAKLITESVTVEKEGGEIDVKVAYKGLIDSHKETYYTNRTKEPYSKYSTFKSYLSGYLYSDSDYKAELTKEATEIVRTNMILFRLVEIYEVELTANQELMVSLYQQLGSELYAESYEFAAYFDNVMLEICEHIEPRLVDEEVVEDDHAGHDHD